MEVTMGSSLAGIPFECLLFDPVRCRLCYRKDRDDETLS